MLVPLSNFSWSISLILWQQTCLALGQKYFVRSIYCWDMIRWNSGRICFNKSLLLGGVWQEVEVGIKYVGGGSQWAAI